MSKLLDISAAAELLSMSESWLRKAVHSGTVPYIKIGRSVRFDEMKLLSWVQAHAVKVST